MHFAEIGVSNDRLRGPEQLTALQKSFIQCGLLAHVPMAEKRAAVQVDPMKRSHETLQIERIFAEKQLRGSYGNRENVV